MKDRIQNIVDVIRKKTDFVPKVALTLGSGLGNFAQEIRVVEEISYHDLPDFPVSTAPGHAGKFIFGYVGSVPVVCMAGRVHLYEGYSTEDVVTPARVMHALGAKVLFLSNAAGGLKPSYHAGTLALVTDHISCFIPNPLIGPNDDEEGVRFPDMTHAYDPELQDIIRKAADREGIRAIGGDIVGMSTVVEAIAAVHMGMRVCCVSLISNLAAGISPVPLSSEDVNAAGEAAAPLFTKLVKASIEAMGETL